MRKPLCVPALVSAMSPSPTINTLLIFRFGRTRARVKSTVLPCPLSAMGCWVYSQMDFPAPSPVAIASDGTVTPSNGDPYNVIDKHFQQPYVESYNLSVQQALPGNFVLDLAYVGNHGVKIPMQFNVNAATRPAVNANGTLASSCTVQPLCVQFARTAATQFLFKPTVSNYNALQARLDHKFKGGFLLTTSYTWAKALAYRSNMGS